MIRAMALALLSAMPAHAAGIADMAGQWTVDLRPDLADKPYTQPMRLEIAADGTGQGRSCVAFRTSDGVGLYHSQACLVDGRMVGTTWAEGRTFLLPWTAER